MGKSFLAGIGRSSSAGKLTYRKAFISRNSEGLYQWEFRSLQNREELIRESLSTGNWDVFTSGKREELTHQKVFISGESGCLQQRKKLTNKEVVISK